MKILILGATGPTGQQLVTQALEKHYEVTALVRKPAKFSIKHEKLTIITGDALDKNAVLNALAGQDAVLSALGRSQSLRSTGLITKAVSILITAMNEMNVKRLIFLSGFGAGETFVQANFLQKIIFRTFLINIYGDKTRAEKMIRSSTLDWTLVYPVVLTNTPATGKYIAAETLTMKGLPKMSRADVATFMLNQLSDNRFIKKGTSLMS